jgi:serine/threonine-protein kinase
MADVDTPGAALLGQRYRLVERLGTGGMSVVWRGYDEVLGRQVAVKVLNAKLAADRSFRHRIRLEAKAAARLTHPHITNVFDYGESDEDDVTVPYVVMELVDGESVAARLRREGRLPWRDAAVICAEVASALAVAHARGVVHRDVTPSNVMLTSTGAKVVDFGISAVVGERDASPDGAVLGTPAYLAPERLEGGEVSAATDVYALGLLLYRMLTGRLPWAASTKTGMLRAHLYSDPAPMPPVQGLPSSVVVLIDWCLAKKASDRPSSVEVARVLSDAAGLSAIPVSPGAPSHTTGSLDVADLDVGTTILPWSQDTDAMSLPSRSVSTSSRAAEVRRRREEEVRSRRRRRVRATAVAAGLVAITGAVWAATSGNPGQDTRPQNEAAPVSAALCRVEYTLVNDTGAAFDADVRLTNTGPQPLSGWRLTFAFPGDQQVVRGAGVRWRQAGQSVLVQPSTDAALVPGRSAPMRFSGRYAGANPLPVEFKLNDAACAIRVAGIAGQDGIDGVVIPDAGPQQGGQVPPAVRLPGGGPTGSPGPGVTGPPVGGPQTPGPTATTSSPPVVNPLPASQNPTPSPSPRKKRGSKHDRDSGGLTGLLGGWL